MGKKVRVCKVKMVMSEGTVIQALLYGCESWDMTAKERRKVDVLAMKCLRMILCLRQVDCIRNNTVRERCSSKHSLIERYDQGVLIWHGYVESMSKE